MSRSVDSATSVVTAAGWIGLVAFFFWQEFRVEDWATPFWFRLPATIVLALVILIFALETLAEEMTVRRWATSVVVFVTFGVLFVVGGIFGVEFLHLSRWILLPLGAFYLLAAGLAGAGARDVF
jgi:hypothetical protein